MATKAQEFRAAAERNAAVSKKRTAKSPAVTPRRTHNEARRAGKKSTYGIETVGARASRKSTRGGANRAKPDSALRITARIRNASPEARAARKSGNPM
jgi:hypothetical protein